VCIAVSGILTYVYLAVVARSLPAAEYAVFGAYWSVALVIGLGAFLPLELELARLVHLRPAGAPLPPGTLRVAGTTTALVLLALAAGWPLLGPVLGDSTALLAALVVLTLASAAQFVLRGLLLGRGRLLAHGVVLLLDALVRCVLAGAVVLWAVPDTAGDLGWTLVAAVLLAHGPLLAWLLWRRRALPSTDGAPDPGPRLAAGSVAHLTVGSLFAQALLNAAPVLVTAAAAPDERVLAAQFVASFTLVRLPLFVAVPLQGALVPPLTALGADPAAARRLIVRTAATVVGLAGAGAVLGWLAGPELVSLLFGERYALPAGDVALLAAGSGLYLGLLLTAQALLAADRHRDVAVVWTVGLAVAAATFAAVPDLVLRAGLSFTLGSGAAFAVSLLLLLRRRARPAPVAAAAVADRKGDAA
jgi:O-antigen/teichoic acid export membrane protein